MGSIIDSWQEACRAAEQIKECPHPDGECMSDLILYGEHMLCCPVFASVTDIEDTGRCGYASRLADSFRMHIADTLATRCDFPSRHIYNFRKKKDTCQMREAMTYNYRNILMLCGPTGTGKSFIAAYLCYRWCMDAYGAYFKNKTEWGDIDTRISKAVKWYTAYEIVTATPQEQKEIAKSALIMVIDDLGTEDNTPRCAAAMNYVISKRYDHDGMHATIITTNMNVGELAVRYGKRLTDRLMEVGQIVQCEEEVRTNRRREVR